MVRRRARPHLDFQAATADVVLTAFAVISPTKPTRRGVKPNLLQSVIDKYNHNGIRRNFGNLPSREPTLGNGVPTIRRISLSGPT